LKEGKWKEADYETLAVMLKASDRESEGWFSLESLKNFPCSDLRTLDLLWVKYSNGRFGFSAQKLIWESVGEDINKFGSSVGWQKKMVFERIQRDWLYYKNLNFNTNAPSGHLPTFVFPFLRDVRIMRWLPLHNEPSVFLSITLSPLMHRLAYCWDFNDILSIVSPQEKDLIDKLIFLIKDMRQSINTYILARREADRLGLKEGNRLGLTIDQSHEMIRLGLRMDEYHEMMGENLLDQLSLVEKAKKNFLLSCTDLPTVTYKRMSEKF
jgi:hypothetical protein